MLEIAISESEKMLLEKAGYENVISFCLLLSYGNIKDLENQNEKTVGDIKVPIKKQLQKLEQCNPKQIRIWYSSLDNEDVCTLYFLNSYFYQKNVQILACDVTDKNHFSVGSYTAKEIRPLEKKTIVIKEPEQKQYNDEWIALVEENSDLRVIHNNSLKSVSFDYLDKRILDILKQYESVRYWKLVGKCMEERLCGFYGDIFFSTRINELIKQNLIEVCEVRKEQNMIGEWKEQKYIRAKKIKKGGFYV